MASNRIVKSVSIDSTIPGIMEFINAQSKFSRSIIALIQQSLAEHNGQAVDVYMESQQKAIMNTSTNPTISNEDNKTSEDTNFNSNTQNGESFHKDDSKHFNHKSNSVESDIPVEYR